jgi:hypothetical protein
MLKLITCILFLFHQTADYRIDFGKYYDSQKQEKAQGYVETFTIKDAEGKQQYIISITKVEIPNDQSVPNVYGADYKQAILSKCGCSITNSTVKQFSYFKAQEFKIMRNGKGACIYSTTKGNKLFSITYSAIGNRNTAEKYPDFEKVINTLEFL